MKKSIISVVVSAIILLSCLPVYAAENVDMVDTTPLCIEATAFTAADGANVTVADYYGQKAMLWNNSKGSVTGEVNIPESGRYNLEIFYAFLSDFDGNGEVTVYIDGKLPFERAQRLQLERSYENGGEVRRDGVGNEFSPEQVERKEFISKRVFDNTGFDITPLEFELEAGYHTLTLYSTEACLAIRELSFVKPYDVPSYSSVKEKYAQMGYENYNGKTLIVEGESASVKNSNMLIALSDGSADAHPASNGQNRLNYIGSSNWETPGERISWQIDIKSEGLYKIALSCRQNINSGGISYRRLYVDDEPLCSETNNLLFRYSDTWDYYAISDKSGEDILLYLQTGVHTLTLEVTLGEITEYAQRINTLNEELGTLYREIVKITGETPDVNRDYALFDQIPQFRESLQDLNERLNELADDLEKLSAVKGNSMVSAMRSMATSIKLMIDNKNLAHRYKSNYYSNYCSMCSCLYELMEMPLDIDRIYLAAPQSTVDTEMPGFLTKISFSIKKLAYSFINDYASVSEKNDDSDRKITIWVNWGRDQAQVLNSLISSYFTPQTGIAVNLRLTNASLVQGIMSGNGPDCALHMDRSQPVNLALRGGLYDLSKFDDYEQVITRFMPGSSIPYEYKNGVYALPDTQVFYMMFVRNDIFNEYGLSIPTTWDEFDNTTRILLRNNMQVTIGTGNNLSGDLTTYATLLSQNGVEFYNEEKNGTNMDTPKAIEVFEKWCGYYLDYKVPVTSDFYNRFRTGVMPLGIMPYTIYNTLSIAAPEITGKWSMYPIPGIQEGDTINNTQVSSGTGCSILELSEDPDAAWSFLKWWTDADTQYKYSQNCESILGVAGRVATSTVEALMRYPWGNDTTQELLSQWKNVKDIAEVPGGYYLSRVVGQIYWNAVSNGENIKEVISKWSIIGDNEIKRKIAEYE